MTVGHGFSESIATLFKRRFNTMADDGKIREVISLVSGEQIDIRALQPGDEQRLQAFHKGLSNETRQIFTPHPYDDATLENLIAQTAAGEDIRWIALVGNTVVGYFFLKNIRDAVPSLGIGIADNYQGMKLGKRFMAMLIDDAAAAGRDGIRLMTVVTNSRAFALYQKTGFVYVKDVEYDSSDGRHIREHGMFMPLKPGAVPPDELY